MWKSILIGIVLGIGMLAGLVLNQWILVAGTITLLLLGLAVYIAQQGRLTLGELESALVVNKQTGNFVRFLSPGQHWIDPFSETVKTKLPLNGQSTKFTSDGIQTCGGIPIKISWQVGYSIRPDMIGRSHLAKMARALSNPLDGMLQKRITAALQHIVGDMTPQELTAQGSIKQLERRIKQICRAKLEDKGIKVSEVLIQNIQLPRHVRESLESVHERELLADQEARVLERLHKVISSFSDEEMHRLIELERIQMLGRNGVTMMYPAMAPQTINQPH